jgi:hypothetical protein
MTELSTFEPLTQLEKEALREQEVRWSTSLDFDRVEQYMKNAIRNNTQITPQYVSRGDKDKRAAAVILLQRQAQSNIDSESLSTQVDTVYIQRILEQTAIGKQILDSTGTYWRFEPTVEKTLSLSESQAEQAVNLYGELKTSDHGTILDQSADKFLKHVTERDKAPDQTKRIAIGIQALQDAIGIYEIGFPLLLGIKRILDGDDPSMESLQQLRAAKVRRELRNTDSHENSVFFDLIVNAYSSNVRNALAHGDLVNDPSERTVRIPNRDNTYTYDEFDTITTEHIAVALFLTGMYQSTLEFSYLRRIHEEVTRDQLAF